MCILKSSSTHLLLLLVFTFGSEAEAAPIYSAHVCTEGSYNLPYTASQTNLNILLLSLVTDATLHDGFYSTNIDNVKGFFLCRGDVAPSLCHDCVTAAAENITRLSTNQTEYIIWYDVCTLRYTNDSFHNNLVPSVSLMNDQNVPHSDRPRFNDFLASTLNDVRQEAVNSSSSGNKKFATKEANFTSSMKLYTLAQCTPDLSNSDCNTCFSSAISFFPTCCDGKLHDPCFPVVMSDTNCFHFTMFH